MVFVNIFKRSLAFVFYVLPTWLRSSGVNACETMGKTVRAFAGRFSIDAGSFSWDLHIECKEYR